MFLPLKCSFLEILYKQLTLSNFTVSGYDRELACFKAMRIQLDNYFNCGNFDFCYFCTKSQFCAITVSEDGYGTL